MTAPDLCTLAYLAGFFDGEGWISIALSKRQRGANMRRMHTLQVGAAQVCLEPLILFKDIWGGTIHRQNGITSSWRASSDKALVFLEDVLPYLIVKRAQAELAIEFRRAVKIDKSRVTDEEYAMRDKYRAEIKSNGIARFKLGVVK